MLTEKIQDKFLEKTIWFFLPFYAIWKLGGELLRDVFKKDGDEKDEAK